MGDNGWPRNRLRHCIRLLFVENVVLIKIGFNEKRYNLMDISIEITGSSRVIYYTYHRRPSKEDTDLPSKWLYLAFKVCYISFKLPVVLCHISFKLPVVLFHALFHSPESCFHPRSKFSKAFVDIAFEISQVLPSLVKLHLTIEYDTCLAQASDTVIQLIDTVIHIIPLSRPLVEPVTHYM